LGCDLGDSFTLAHLAQRPNASTDFIHRLLPADIQADLKTSDLESALADYLYKGYIENQNSVTERVNRHDALNVPDSFDFHSISGLSNEMIERLNRSRPQTFGDVRRIPGLTPAAVSTLLVHLSAQNKKAA
jgi:tRNA uridine 5-carboxymethylaminomethyl modification enzyme